MKIMVIDDDALVARTLARLLRSHDVHVFTGANEALVTLFTGGFDIIFCDLMMPVLTGPELFSTVSERDPELAGRFVFMTGGAFTTECCAFLDSGKHRVLRKPFDRQSLQAMLDSASGAPESR